MCDKYPNLHYGKRLFDLLFSFFGLIVLVPLFIIISILVKATSKGPVLYFGERVGLRGHKFKIWKFRTMIPDAEMYGTTTAMNDSRLTGIGAFLRKYKLDELPQLVNVIKGDMSLVGPRPEVEEHTSEYNDEEMRILSVRPGITDYASVTFHNLAEVLGTDNPHEIYLARIRLRKNQLRLEYVNNCSFWEDIRIIILTLNLLLSLIFCYSRKKNGIFNIR
jgi:lipopolysaccharide/colanic/teichoic acid biosynthesis glycosyltransferase